MEYEIDFLPVGDGEKGGDAIAVRYGNLHGSRSEQVVLVIDGGTKESGGKLVEHIKRYYGTERVDLVISTHPDIDHISGLTEVLEKMKVDILWMHRPWEHAADIKDLFKSGRITDNSLKENLKKSLEQAYEIETIAKEKDIKLCEPFSDEIDENSQLLILSPSKEFYENLIPHFRETPAPKESIGILGSTIKAVKEGIKWVSESWGIETLSDPEENETSAENNSGVVFLLKFAGRKFLFTGDAGAEALNEAISKAEELGIDLKTVNFIQIPHHGSKHNVGPAILNSIMGPRLSEETDLKTAYVSAPKEGDPKHPSRKVVNAFKRRGAKVFATKGGAKYHYSGDVPDRRWSKAEPLPFYSQVLE